MAWTTIPGTGNLILAATDAMAAGIGSLINFTTQSFTIASAFAVQTVTNVGGSAAAITGQPQLFVQVGYRGTDYLIPIYRKS